MCFIYKGFVFHIVCKDLSFVFLAVFSDLCLCTLQTLRICVIPSFEDLCSTQLSGICNLNSL